MRTLAMLVLLGLNTSCWAQKLDPKRVYPSFAIGPSGIYASIEKQKQITVTRIAAKTAAAESGLAVGDVLISAASRSLDVEDPRIPLGLAIVEAEANDGKLSLNVRRGEQPLSIILNLPLVGSYSDEWPTNCKKSDRIIEATAQYVASCQTPDGTYRLHSGRGIRDNLQGCLTSLFLLSTGDDAYLPNVRLHAHRLANLAKKRQNAGGHVNWQLGYQGILLAEYFLRTGDRTVLAGLQELCDWCIDNQAAGGWGHGNTVGPGYVQSGLMNHAGIPILITLTLAQECGLDVDPTAYSDAIRLMYRMVGHGCIAYGDHRSELWWSNTNGRNAMLACAFSLLSAFPQYKAASQHLARLVTDSYFQPEFGHTGGGFNVIWRGIASVHVPSDQRVFYHRQMRILGWYYDLTRQPRGGFSILPTPRIMDATREWIGGREPSVLPTPRHVALFGLPVSLARPTACQQNSPNSIGAPTLTCNFFRRKAHRITAPNSHHQNRSTTDYFKTDKVTQRSITAANTYVTTAPWYALGLADV